MPNGMMIFQPRVLLSAAFLIFGENIFKTTDRSGVLEPGAIEFVRWILSRQESMIISRLCFFSLNYSPQRAPRTQRNVNIIELNKLGTYDIYKNGNGFHWFIKINKIISVVYELIRLDIMMTMIWIPQLMDGGMVVYGLMVGGI